MFRKNKNKSVVYTVKMKTNNKSRSQYTRYEWTLYRNGKYVTGGYSRSVEETRLEAAAAKKSYEGKGESFEFTI